VGSADYLNQLTGGTNGLSRSGTATSIGLSSQIPLFQGGLPAARIREAQALQGQAQEQLVGTERAVVQATRAAFARYEASERAIESNTVAVQANELALEGARAEQSVGTRTVLDVLNAEQELLNSQVALVTAKRDAYVAGFQLLNAMGQAEAQDLGLEGGPLYDPLGNYRRVAGNWSDWASDPRHPVTSTRTVSPQEMPVAPVVTPQAAPARIDPSVPAPAQITPVPPPNPATTAPLPSKSPERG
jgi:outer membrane protein